MVKLSEFTVVRDSLHTERMLWLYHRLGINSNVLVAAQYAHDSSGARQRLTRSQILRALRVVIEMNPQMRIIGVPQPPGKNGRTKMDIGILHAIDVESCVRFVDDKADGGITAELIEQAHNEWSFIEQDQPLFKLIVVGLNTIVFVYHHLLGDGASGSIFHRHLLAALNADTFNVKQLSETSSSSWVVPWEQETKDVMPMTLTDLGAKARKLGKPWAGSTFEMLKAVAHLIGHGWLFGKHYCFSELNAPANAAIPSPTGVANEKQRSVTRNAIGRIPATTMDTILTACRKHGATFTGIMHILIMITLAKDVYPTARYISGRTTFDFRTRLPFTLAEPEATTIGNRSGSISSSIYKTDRLRSAETSPPGADSNNGTPKPSNLLDAPLVWSLAKEESQRIRSEIDPGCRIMFAYESAGSPDLDHLITKVLPTIGASFRYSYLLSNGGLFAPHADESTSNPWTITNIALSSAITNGRYGSRGPIFYVLRLKGGDTTVVAGWEEGVATREMAEKVLNGTLTRLEALAAMG